MNRREASRRFARRDVLTVLIGAQAKDVRLTPFEVHLFCYFARVLSTSLSHAVGTALPYEFTYGHSGGPYSSEIQAEIDSLILWGVLSLNAQDGENALLELSADSLLLDAIALDREFDMEENDEYLIAIIDSCVLWGLPAICQAIMREPSLEAARVSGLREGMPLERTASTFCLWLLQLRERMSSKKLLGCPNEIVPVLVETFRRDNGVVDASTIA